MVTKYRPAVAKATEEPGPSCAADPAAAAGKRVVNLIAADVVDRLQTRRCFHPFGEICRCGGIEHSGGDGCWIGIANRHEAISDDENSRILITEESLSPSRRLADAQ
jgi:hypothetical protein